MKLSLIQKVYLGFGLMLVLLLVVAILVVRSQRQFVSSQELTRHTYQVIDELQQIPNLLAAAESSRLSFLLTRDKEFLKPFEGAVAQVPGTLQSVRRLTADNPRQQQRLDQLEPVVGQKLAEFRKSIALSRPGGDGTDRQGAFALDGATDETIHTTVAALVNEERGLLSERSARSGDAARATQVFLLLAGAMGIATVLLAGMMVRRDLAARQRSEESTRKSQTLFRQLFEASPDAVLLVQADGRIARANRQAAELFGYRPEVLTGGCSVDALLPKRFHAAHAHLRAGYAAAPTTRPMGQGRELFALRPDGTEFATEISLSPVETEDGPMTLCVVRDITERKRMERDRQALFEIIQGVNAGTDMDSLLKLIHQTIRKVVYAENCFVALNEENTGMLNMQFFVDQRDPLPAPQKVGRGRTGYVFRTGAPIVMTNELFERLIEQGEIESIGTPPASWLGVPLKTPSKTIGVLVVQHYEDDQAYDDRDVEFLFSVGRQIAVAIERNRSEEARRLSEERYREIFEMDLTGSCISSADGRILACNPAFARIFGFPSVAEVLQAPTRSFYGSAQEREELLNLVYKHKKLENFETELVRRDGSSMSVVQNLQGVFDESGALIEMHSHFIDVTSHKHAEKQLQESEERLRLALDAAHMGTFDWDVPHNRITWSRWHEEMWGFKPGEFGGTYESFSERVHPDDLPGINAEAARCIAAREPFAREFRVVWPDGTVHWIMGRGEFSFDANGQALRMCGAILETTEHRQAEEALRESETQLRQSQKLEAVGQLAGGIAHDFNNLLTAINGYSSLALKRLDDASPLKSYIEEVKKAGDRAANLTRQLLAFSRKQILEPKVLDLNEVVGDMSKMLRRMIGEDVQLATSPARELGRVKADPGQIEQIIMNLVVNARDAMPNGGKVTIETSDVHLDDEYAREHMPTKPGHYVLLAVSDTGTGMDAETQARIFEPFFTTKEVDKGTGLGLSTVYGIVKQSDGFVWVYSEPGHGTTFKVYLPVVDAEKTAAAKPLDDDAQIGTETILLVEDEEVVRNLAQETLEAAGYEVLVAGKGEEAIRLGIEHPHEIHLLLSDVVMPGASGNEVAEQLRSLRPKTKVLFMSGYTDEAIVHHGVLASGVRFIQKPFSLAALCRKVREVLDSN